MQNQRELPIALRRAYLAMHRSTDHVFAKYEVTADQFVLLAALSDDQALTQRQLGLRISSDPSTVRAMLVLLEKKGFVERKSHAADARAKTVSLTPAGKRKFNQLWKAGQKIRKQMYSALGPDETEQFIEFLNRITRSLDNNRESHSKSHTTLKI